MWNSRPATEQGGPGPKLSEAAKALGETEDRLRGAAKSRLLWKVVRIAPTGEHLQLVTAPATLADLFAEAERHGIDLDAPLPESAIEIA